MNFRSEFQKCVTFAYRVSVEQFLYSVNMPKAIFFYKPILEKWNADKHARFAFTINIVTLSLHLLTP